MQDTVGPFTQQQTQHCATRHGLQSPGGMQRGELRPCCLNSDIDCQVCSGAPGHRDKLQLLANPRGQDTALCSQGVIPGEAQPGRWARGHGARHPQDPPPARGTHPASAPRPFQGLALRTAQLRSLCSWCRVRAAPRACAGPTPRGGHGTSASSRAQVTTTSTWGPARQSCPARAGWRTARR